YFGWSIVTVTSSRLLLLVPFVENLRRKTTFLLFAASITRSRINRARDSASFSSPAVDWVPPANPSRMHVALGLFFMLSAILVRRPGVEAVKSILPGVKPLTTYDPTFCRERL